MELLVPVFYIMCRYRGFIVGSRHLPLDTLAGADCPSFRGLVEFLTVVANLAVYVK